MRAKAKITIMVDCYDDHNEKVLEESHESEYVFDSWQQAHTTYQLARTQIEDRQTRERKPVGHKPVMENTLPPYKNSNRYED